MKKIIGAAVLAGILFGSCVKKKDLDFKNLRIDNWNPDWALPILSSDLTLKNILQPNTFITEDAQGVYSLHYAGDIFSARVEDYVQIPDQNLNTPAFTLSVPMNVNPFSSTINDSITNSHFTYTDPSGSQLAHLNIKSGNIVLTINSTFRQNVTATIIFPDAKKNGTPLQVSANITYPSTSSSMTVDLAGYNFDLTNGGTAHNYLNYKIRFTVSGTGQPLLMGDNFSANVKMEQLKYSFLDGFIGGYDIPIPSDTINVAVFDNTINAQIFVNDPKINLTFRNSIGVNVSTVFDALYGTTATGINTGNYITNPINVNGAPAPGLSSTSTYIMDSASTAGKVQQLFNPAPNKVIYGGRVRINPGGASTTYSFLTDSSAISMSADAQLPAWFKIVTFTLQDTTQLLLPEDSSILQSAEFKLLMDNALPLYGRVQVYFADANFGILDSLVTTGGDIIGEAPVDAQGRVSGRLQKESLFNMTHDEYNAMASRVRYALIRGQLKSSGSNSIKIQSSNNMKVKLAFRFKLNVSQTDL